MPSVRPDICQLAQIPKIHFIPFKPTTTKFSFQDVDKDKSFDFLYALHPIYWQIVDGTQADQLLSHLNTSLF